MKHLLEMAYPDKFKLDHLNKLTSYKARIGYARSHLQKLSPEGTSRVAFLVDDEKVLKVAKNTKGIAQNKAEIENSDPDYAILAKVFATDPKYYFLEMELAKKVSNSQFNKLTNISIENLENYLQFLHYSDKKSPLAKASYSKSFDTNEWLQDLLMFIRDYDYPITLDFAKLSSFGVVTRNNKDIVVLIDFGFDHDAMKLYNHYV